MTSSPDSPTSFPRISPQQTIQDLKIYQSSMGAKIATWILDHLGLGRFFETPKHFHASEWVNRGMRAEETKDHVRAFFCFQRAMRYLHGTKLPGSKEVSDLATLSLDACELSNPQQLQERCIVALQAVKNKDPNAAQVCLDFLEHLEEAMGATDWKGFVKEREWLKGCDLSSLYKCIEKSQNSNATLQAFVQFCRYYGIGTDSQPKLAKQAYEQLAPGNPEAAYHLAMIDFRDFPTKAAEEKLEACNNPKAHYQLGHYYWTIQEIFYGTGKLAHLDDQRDRKELRRDAIWHLHQAKEKGHPRATSEFQAHEKTLGSATVSRMLNTYRQIHRPRS